MQKYTSLACRTFSYAAGSIIIAEKLAVAHA